MPIFFLFILWPSNNLLKFYNHYLIILCPLFFYLTNKTTSKYFLYKGKIKNIIIILQIIFHVILSNTLISFNLYLSENNMINYKTYLNNKYTSEYKYEIIEMIENINIKNISITNNLGIEEIYQKYNIEIFPDYDQSNLIILLLDKPFYIGEKIYCNLKKHCDIDLIIRNYSNNLEEFEKKYTDNKIIILERKTKL